MKERGIIFSAPMVRALLAGTKTQTRRLMNPQPEPVPADKLLGRAPGSHWWPSSDYQSMLDVPGEIGDSCCPYGMRGDRLWVRETWQAVHYAVDCDGVCDDMEVAGSIPKDARAGDGHASWWTARYAATDPEGTAHRDDRGFAWRPGIHMPRWASRITLEITSVRVERLQDISEEDARAEGIACTFAGEWTRSDGTLVTGRPWAHSFLNAWRGIHGASPLAGDPWVWAVSFRVVAPELAR